MHHSFDITIAEKHGVNVAIFLNNVAFWIQKNIANERHFYEKKFWTYNSQKALCEIFPYWTRQNIRTIINYCTKNKLIITGSFNKHGYDHTTWYALTEKGLALFPALEAASMLNGENQPKHLLESTNRRVGINHAIPDIKPDIKTNKREGNASRSLSALNLSNCKQEIIELLGKSGINAEHVIDKFKTHQKSKGKKMYKDEDFGIWCLREVEYLKKNGNKKYKADEVRSTVPVFVPEKEVKKATPKVHNENMDAINKKLGRKRRGA